MQMAPLWGGRDWNGGYLFSGGGGGGGRAGGQQGSREWPEASRGSGQGHWYILWLLQYLGFHRKARPGASQVS